MNIKQNNLIVNSQEDEDGFSLNPFNVFIYDRTTEHQDLNTIRNAKNSEYGDAKNNMTNSKKYDISAMNLIFKNK